MNEMLKIQAFGAKMPKQKAHNNFDYPSLECLCRYLSGIITTVQFSDLPEELQL